MERLLMVWLSLAVLIITSLPVQALHTAQCSTPLGMQSKAIPDEHITASSYYDAAVNAIYARAHSEMGGGAWCPKEMVYREGTEYLEVNLAGLHIVTKVEVQGRFGNGQGREFAKKYKLQIWRPGLEHWVTYTDGRGEELLEGNTNTYLAKSSQLSPPVIATRVRFVPYSDHPRTICMRVELYGCRYSDGLVSYSMPDGDVRGGGGALRDVTYDGSRKEGYLTGGLGQLTDGETGHTNFRVDALGKGRGYEWVGWKNDTRGKKPIEIEFEFDTFRNFSTLHIYANNFFTKDTQVFSHARILFSAGGKYYHVLPSVDYKYVVDRIFENARNVTINLHNMAGRYVKLQLFFSLRWMMISEIAFDSVPCRCELTEEEPPIPVPTERPDADGLGNETAPSISAQESPSSVLLGGLVALGIILAMIPMAIGVVYYRGRMIRKANKKSPPSSDNGLDAKKVSMKMKDVHINVNLTPMSNGYSRAKGKLYGHVAMDDETMAMYQKPFKGPMHNDGYYTLARDGTPSEIPLKCPLPLDTDDSVDYAVPDMNVTPPPPFSEVYTPPPPVPLTLPPVTLPASRTHREASLPPPMPPIPPPPEQEYYAAPLLCQSSDIQSVTGSVKYTTMDFSKVDNGRKVPEIPRNHIRVVESLGDGAFGSVQLCEAKHIAGNASGLVTMKSLKVGASEDVKEDLQQEYRTLSQVDDPNIVRLLGVVTSEPIGLIFEYLDYGDLYHFLQRHILEGVGSQSSLGSSLNIGDPPVLSYGALVYIASQIANGMKYLESLSIVHRDLAARNCLVGTELTIKIADFGMSRPLYSRHYYRSNSDRSKLPIRWMAWESVLQGKFTTKSDVWSFGVTLWEVLTMGRQQPYDKLSDEGVLENLSHCYHGDGTGMMLLPQPSLCPREIYEMMTACWRPNERQRPPFWEILMFLRRKNLGYSLDYFL